jgi:Htaa
MNDVTQAERGRGTMTSVVAMVAALVALLAFAPFASAATDPLASGTTTITINKGLFKKLKKAGVKVLKVSPASVKGKKVSLPVSGGSLDPLTGLGTVEHSGGFKFKRGKKKAVVNTIVLETTTSSLKAKVAGKSMKLATVKGTTVARNGFGANVSITALKLTGKAAKQLNKKLGFTGKNKKKAPFKNGRNLGASVSETQPKTVTVLAGGKARLATNEATVKKFSLAPPNGNAVKIEPISPTEAELGPSPFAPILAFPIAGGTIAPNASGGVVQTSGGVRLVQTVAPEKTTTMTLGNIWVDLTAKTATVEVTVESTISPQLNLGNLNRISIADINLTGATIKSDPTARTVTVENAAATLQEVTAGTLNSVFGAPFDASEPPIPHPKFAAGDPLGTFSFTVQTQ